MSYVQTRVPVGTDVQTGGGTEIFTAQRVEAPRGHRVPHEARPMFDHPDFQSRVHEGCGPGYAIDDSSRGHLPDTRPGAVKPHPDEEVKLTPERDVILNVRGRPAFPRI